MNILDPIANFFTGASANLRKAVLVIIVATLVLRFPWLVTSWADPKFSQWVMSTADSLRDLALPFLLLFAKQFNATGGTKPATDEAEKRIES